MHLAEKILLPQPLTFEGELPIPGPRFSVWRNESFCDLAMQTSAEAKPMPSSNDERRSATTRFARAARYKPMDLVLGAVNQRRILNR